MKSLILALSFATTMTLWADETKIVQKGDLLVITTAAGTPINNGSPAKVLEVGPGDWVQVEVDRTMRKADGSAGAEKGKMWVNFDHVVSVQKVEK